tara:strand:+ start:15774 stop:16097 length:324 start_codon:yes stop_codon:yes gene_type:complete
METKELIELLKLTENKSQSNGEVPFKVGEKYFIRTVTYHLTGRVKKIVGNFLVLEDAAWIADSGRFMEAIDEGNLSEVEPVKTEVYVNVGSITDAFEWKHELPRKQK